MKKFFCTLAFVALSVSAFAQTRNVLVNSNDVVVSPTNLWNANASNARTGLGLGSAATNPASAFQPSSLALSNLASNNAINLTNFPSNLLRTNGSAAGLTNFPSSILQTTSSVTNFPSELLRTNGSAAGLTGFPTVALASNITGILAIANGGTGATNAANARTALGATTVGNALFTAANEGAARSAIGASVVGQNIMTLLAPLGSTTFLRMNVDNTVSAISAADFRTALSLGTAATNPSTAFQPASVNLTTLANNDASGLTNIPASGLSGAVAITNGGSGATTAGGARTNFGLGATNDVSFNSVAAASGSVTNVGFKVGSTADNGMYLSIAGLGFARSGVNVLNMQTSSVNFAVPFAFTGASASANAATSRTNLGIPWTGLTNTNVQGFITALGLDNFAPTSLRFIADTNVGSGFNAGIDYRSNTISWWTDDAGGTGSPLITLPYYGNNGSIVVHAPIEFTTNTNSFFPQTNNPAAQTRINLGFSSTNVIDLGGFTSLLDPSWGGGYNMGMTYRSNSIRWWNDDTGSYNDLKLLEFPAGNQNGSITVYAPLTFLTNSNTYFPQTNNPAAVTRTNLGLGLPALTNTSNVTAMRALAGSTNTNHPYTGVIDVYDSISAVDRQLVFSNGILLEVNTP